MSTTTPTGTGTATRSAADDRLPWPSLVALAAVTFVAVTGEMLPTAVLPQMSADLGVPESRTGLLVSAWAATVVVATVPLARFTSRWERRRVISGALLTFALSGAVVAAAPTFEVAAGGRLVGAASAGLIWATVNAHTADVVPDHRLARAVAVVLGGGTLGTVLGVPLASLVARVADWRLASAALAVVGLGAAVAVRVVVVPALARSTPPGADVPVRRPSVRPVLAVGGLLAVVIVGHFTVHTFVTRLVEVPATALPGGVSTMLLLLGGTSALGLVLASRGDRRLETWLVASATGTAVAVAALLLVDRSAVVAVLVVAAWGLASGATPPLVQTLMLRRAGPELRDTAGMIIPIVFNGGIAVGAALGSTVVARAGAGALPVPAAVTVAVGALGLAVVTGVVRVRAPRTEAATPCVPCVP